MEQSGRDPTRPAPHQPSAINHFPPVPAPNLILITWHDLGDFLGCYGHGDVASPCLDRLASQGALMEQHFCSAPQCSPSRASIVTGLMPHNTGVLGLTHRGFDMDRRVTTLKERLKDGRGYHYGLR